MGNNNGIKTGDKYNPFKLFVGLFIPNSIAGLTGYIPKLIIWPRNRPVKQMKKPIQIAIGFIFEVNSGRRSP